MREFFSICYHPLRAEISKNSSVVVSPSRKKNSDNIINTGRRAHRKQSSRIARDAEVVIIVAEIIAVIVAISAKF